jgi:hypothetical protein
VDDFVGSVLDRGEFEVVEDLNPSVPVTFYEIHCQCLPE